MLAVLKLGANVDALYTPDGILPTMHCRGRLFSVIIMHANHNGAISVNRHVASDRFAVDSNCM